MFSLVHHIFYKIARQGVGLQLPKVIKDWVPVTGYQKKGLDGTFLKIGGMG